MTTSAISFSKDIFTVSTLAKEFGLIEEDLAPQLASSKVGSTVPIAGHKYYKRGNNAFSPRIEEPADASAAAIDTKTVENENGDLGAEEMEWARRLSNLYQGRFRMVEIEHNGKRVLHRADQYSREVMPTDHEALIADMRNFIGSQLSLKEATAVTHRTFDLLSSDPRLLVKEGSIAPLLFEGQSPERFTYRRLPISNEPLAICPAPFKELLSRMATDGARSVELWLGSLLDENSDRSQYLVLYGPGNNGKSSLVDGLVSVLGRAAISMSSGDFLNRFGLGEAGGARLLAFDDNNNASFMTTGDFKRVTGSKTLKVERKGKDSYRTRNNLKILIACNRLPELSGDMADMRRNVLVRIDTYSGGKTDEGKVKPGRDGAWVRRLQEAMPDVLRYCYTEWMAYRAAHGTDQVPVTKETEDEVYNVSMEAQVEDFMGTYLMVDDAGKLRPADLHDKATIVAKMPPKVYEYLKHHMNEKYRLQRENNQRHYPGIRLRDQV